MKTPRLPGLFVAVEIIVTCIAVTRAGDPDILKPWTRFPVDCKLTRGGQEYAGQVNVTQTGIPCQPWASNIPHYNYYRDSDVFPEGSAAGAGSNCRNPDYNWNEGAWCHTSDPDIRWQKCNVSFCECKMLTNGTDYEGETSVTSSGRVCQSWSSQDVHQHAFTDSHFPDGSLSRASNFCRNPNVTWPGGPWCYTNDPDVEWEYCNVSNCDIALWERPTTVTAAPTTSSTTTRRVTQSTTSRPSTMVATSRGTMATTTRVTTPSTIRTSRATTKFTTRTLATESIPSPSKGRPGEIVDGGKSEASSQSSGADLGLAVGLPVAIVALLAVIGVTIFFLRHQIRAMWQRRPEKFEHGIDNPSYATATDSVNMEGDSAARG